MNPLRQQALEIIQDAIRQTTGSAARLSALAEAEESSADSYACIAGRLRELDETEDFRPLLDQALAIANERVGRCEQISADYNERVGRCEQISADYKMSGKASPPTALFNDSTL